MSYRIRITQTAQRDLEEAADYIEYVLKAPEAAERLLGLAEEKFGALEENPMIYPIVDDPVLKSCCIRLMIVNNYLALYTVDEAAGWVVVVRFLYGKRDWATILRQGMDLSM